MPEELNLPEATRGADPLSIEPDPLSIEPDPLSIRPEPAAGAAPMSVDDDEPISLVEGSDASTVEEGLSKVRQLEMERKKSHEVTLKRDMNLTGTGATRCRVFYCRFAVEAIENMQARINEWIDSDEIEIKHVSQTTAVMEGKNPKPNMFITVWY